ncbi:hypothetical protein NDU88_004332 [Pleurodeles waltl]|uniref:Uncharacterized protein n=1 Tax=Pleurodeles waltl TaxID=8319 RepID=A0AAV7W4Q9_PLEWA|nr:hypothetical protein NDU88_004332 [Pleurodeles waltl]
MLDPSRPAPPGKATEIQPPASVVQKPQPWATKLCSVVGCFTQARYPHPRIRAPGRYPSPLLVRTPPIRVSSRLAPLAPGSPLHRHPPNHATPAPDRAQLSSHQ